jgi:hypothetical protein
MKATVLLKKQHRKVEGMFATLEKGMGARMLRAFEAASDQGYEALLPEGFATSADRDQMPMPVRPSRTQRTGRGQPDRVAP